MKTKFIYSAILIAGLSLNAQEKEKETVKDYLETIDGVKYDMKVRFTHFDLKNITVGDSLTILENKFKKKKTTKITSLEKSITSLEKSIAKQDEKTGFSAISAKALKQAFTLDKEKLEKKLEELKTKKYKAYEPYLEKDSAVVLSKLVNAHFYATRPGQEESLYSTKFILDSTGNKCLKRQKIKKINATF